MVDAQAMAVRTRLTGRSLLRRLRRLFVPRQNSRPVQSAEPPPAVGLSAGAGRVLGRSVDQGLLRGMMSGDRKPDPTDYERIALELERAEQIYLDPAFGTFHRDPAALPDVQSRSRRLAHIRFEHLWFDSGLPVDRHDEFGQRWQRLRRNRTAHAWAMRQPEPGRPWLVCLHGIGTGQPVADFAGFRALTLYRRHGFNLLFPVLPQHGPRRDPGVPLGSMLSYEMVDNLLGLRQAVWDVRRWLAWARGQGAQRIGMYGLSLGAYTGAVVSGLEDVDWMIAGIPLADIPAMIEMHCSEDERRLAYDHGVLGDRLDRLYQLVSPRQVESRIPAPDRHIFAGAADHVTTPRQAALLGEHWGDPDIHWFDGGHVSYLLSRSVRQFVDDRLANYAAVEDGD